MLSLNISNSLMNIFTESVKASVEEGYPHLVVFPRSTVSIAADDKVRASALVAAQTKEFSLADVSNDYVSGQISVHVGKKSPQQTEGDSNMISFAGFKSEAEQQKLLTLVAAFDFYNEEKQFAVALNGQRDALPADIGITSSNNYSHRLK